MPDYLVRLVQMHESFRRAELEALAELAGVNMEIVRYNEDSPFCIIRLPSHHAAKTVISRSILSQGIHELWGHGPDYDSLHASVRANSSDQWSKYHEKSFRFTLDCFRGTRSHEEHRNIIESFSFLDFQGPIRMREAEAEFRIFEDYDDKAPKPKYLFMGRFVGSSGRHAKTTYDLKKRHYISTTSMDAELALLTANIALAAPGKLFYDPFMGTGGFPVASAHYGAVVCGSDIDGRSIRGTGGSARRGQTGKKDVEGNFKQYGIQGRYLGGFVSDLTNTPLRIHETKGGYLDGIICDPPYGIREGLKVLGSRQTLGDVERSSHRESFKDPSYIPPKKPYSFIAMLDDILEFAQKTLVPGGRLSMWMPTANDEDIELMIPTNPYLQVVSVCVQPFNKWSRRLLTYKRLKDEDVPPEAIEKKKREYEKGVRADDLNVFRRKYFEGFKEYVELKREAQGAASAIAESKSPADKL